MNIAQAMTDPHLFGDAFGGDSWAKWRALLSGFYGDETDFLSFRDLTRRVPPVSASNELWLVVGRRGGKSNIAALIAVYEAIFNDHASKLSPGEVATVMVIAADRKQARTVMRYIKGLVENPMLALMIVRQTEESIELVNRYSIEIMTASFRSLRGYTVAAAILDEIAFWHSDGASPDSEIVAALRPSMASLRGKLIALSSPYARRGVLWENYRKHYGKQSKILVAQASTQQMNETLDPQFISDAYNDDPMSAAAEYGAQFRTDVESFVSIEVVEACTRPSYPEIMPASGIHYFAFVDPSGGSQDAMTLAIAHLDDDDGVVVIDAVRSVRPPFSPESVVEEFVEVLKPYRITTIHGDAYAGEWPREQFKKRGVSYLKSDKNKSELYQNLLPLLNSGRIELPPIQQLQKELIGLERRTSRAGRDSIDHAPGMHDDLANVIAGVAAYASKPRPAMSIKMGMAY